MKNKILIPILSIALFTSCYKEEIITADRPEGWGYYSHSDQIEPNYNLVFPQNEVKKMYIEITASDWTVMQDDIESLYGGSTGGGPGGGSGFAEEKPVTVKCQIYVDDLQWFDVGIRYKGNSSLSFAYQSGKGKLPLRLDFDYFEDENLLIDDQRYYGFKELSLGSNFNDNSFMHEKVATDLFRQFGVPAPMTSYYEIYVDNGDGNGYTYFGLYTLMEVVFDTMLNTQFSSENGNCYKPDGDAATFSTNYGFNSEEFEKKTNEDQADWSDVENVYNFLNSASRTTNLEQWKSDLENAFDIDGFLKYLAANTVMQNWDTYGRMTHNYYLYADPSDNLVKWIPWDNNEALNDDKNNALDFDFASVNDTEWPLIGFLYDTPEYKIIYDNYIDDFITSVFTESNVNNLYQDYHTLITSSVQNESGIYTFLNNYSDFTSALTTQQNHTTSRISEADVYTP